jgi:hypothetical protein
MNMVSISDGDARGDERPGRIYRSKTRKAWYGKVSAMVEALSGAGRRATRREMMGWRLGGRAEDRRYRVTKFMYSKRYCKLMYFSKIMAGTSHLPASK